MRKAILTITLLLLSLLVLFLLSLPDHNLHVVFCDVGQGDGILITYGLTEILVDGGPDNKILSCLSGHIPFFDRQIEALVNTHPQLDHFGGFISVLKRYKVINFFHPDIEGTSSEWQIFKEELKLEKIYDKIVGTGNKIRVNNGGTKLSFDILNPSSGFVGGDLNEYSIVGILSYGDFDVLLTGDIQPPQIDKISGIHPVEVLKVPHHGSKNGLTSGFLEAASPQLAVISVGRHNRYGHPSKESLELLGSQGVRTLRTDLDGEIEVISDGKRWWVNK